MQNISRCAGEGKSSGQIFADVVCSILGYEQNYSVRASDVVSMPGHGQFNSLSLYNLMTSIAHISCDKIRLRVNLVVPEHIIIWAGGDNRHVYWRNDVR